MYLLLLSMNTSGFLDVLPVGRTHTATGNEFGTFSPFKVETLGEAFFSPPSRMTKSFLEQTYPLLSNLALAQIALDCFVARQELKRIIVQLRACELFWMDPALQRRKYSELRQEDFDRRQKSLQLSAKYKVLP